MEQAGGRGAWGFYEALDFTPERVPPNKKSLIVQCYMSHHQGMSLLAIGNLLQNGAIRRRFHAQPLIRATELLLQERMPRHTSKNQPHPDENASPPEVRTEDELVSRRIVGMPAGPPRIHLLSNGEFSTLVTNSGG